MNIEERMRREVPAEVLYQLLEQATDWVDHHLEPCASTKGACTCGYQLLLWSLIAVIEKVETRNTRKDERQLPSVAVRLTDRELPV